MLLLHILVNYEQGRPRGDIYEQHWMARLGNIDSISTIIQWFSSPKKSRYSLNSSGVTDHTCSHEINTRLKTLYLLHEILRGDGLEHVLLGRLLDFAAQKELVQHEVGLLEVEDDVELAD